MEDSLIAPAINHSQKGASAPFCVFKDDFMNLHLAWLCYEHEWADGGVQTGKPDPEQPPKILFKEPEQWQYAKIVPIVWAQITPYEGPRGS